MGFMVFKSTGSDSGFQRINRFCRICTASRDSSQNVSIFAGLVWKADFRHFFDNILDLGAYFSKPIFALKPWVRAGRFEYHEPYNPKKFFWYLLWPILMGKCRELIQIKKNCFFEHPYYYIESKENTLFRYFQSCHFSTKNEVARPWAG